MSNQEIVRPVNTGAFSRNENGQWTPIEGEELSSFLNGKPTDMQTRLRKDSKRILGSGIIPGEVGVRCGLVIGYVQSGKTSSFTSVAALAHDCGFGMVIVIAGTSNMLVGQTADRLVKDFGLEGPDAPQRWTVCRGPKLGNDAGIALLHRLENLKDPSGPRMGGIPLVVVMKEKTNLANLNEVLLQAAGVNRLGLKDISVLIVDDEAHMHTQNIAEKKTGEESRIYSLLKEMRSYCPSHTLLQYTATPQANLLAEVEDEFSPDFVRLLDAGPNYLGGREIFIDHLDEVVRVIPQSEKSSLDPLSLGAPESLEQALANFLLVCAIDYLKLGKATTHSMMVHSDAKQNVHANFHSWIGAMRTSWVATLSGPDCPDKQILLDLFVSEYENLEETVDAPPPLIELMKIAISVLRDVHLFLADSNGKNRVPWSQANYWILNGGNMLGVGYTVEGLTTTHMLRSKKQQTAKRRQDGMADTIQQRGRFFGYRQQVVDRCRVWLPEEMVSAFRAYVEHEERIRTDLMPYDISNKSLRGWKRRFWLDPALEPTRKKAQRLILTRFSTEDDGWVKQQRVCNESSWLEENRRIAQDFLLGVGEYEGVGNFVGPSPGSGPNDETRHTSAICTIDDLRTLLVSWKFDEDDRRKFESVLVLLDEYSTKEHENYHSVVAYSMGGLGVSRRERSVKNFRLTLFQGWNANYDGDKAVKDKKIFSVQIHSLDLKTSNGLVEDVPFLAVYIPSEPERFAKNLIVEVD